MPFFRHILSDISYSAPEAGRACVCADKSLHRAIVICKLEASFNLDAFKDGGFRSASDRYFRAANVGWFLRAIRARDLPPIAIEVRHYAAQHRGDERLYALVGSGTFKC